MEIESASMPDDIANWLEKLGLGKYVDVFAENAINIDVLPHLSEEDLKELGLPLGHRRKLQAAIQTLADSNGPMAPSAMADASPSSEPERRQLTVMFCDLVGSTALAERLDPEELHALLAQYQDTCADVIDQYDGYIARYVGDGLLVYFGYPQAHEDDAQRGVRAGLGIVDAIRDLEAKIANPNVDLAVRIGITTGLVVAGDIGGGERVEEKAIVGETPNLAARLQTLAEPNAVVIGANTQRLVEGLFECDDLGPQNLKGISQSVAAYRVRAESSAPSSFEAKAARGLTLLVGREEEIGLLLERWREAKDGEGQVVLLSGEAGIGKSRIVRDFRQRLEDELHNRIAYYCSPYRQNSAFYPAIDQLERGLRFEKDDSSADRLDKLDAVLGNLGLPVAVHAFPLASLLLLPVNGRYPPLELSPAQLKKKTLEAIVAMVQAMSSQQPVLMSVEDIHWIDPSTQELISLLMEQLQTARFLLVVTSRPEFESSWGGYAHVTSLTLNRLSRKASTAMIERVTGGKALPDDVLDQIVAKTDGVPLFVEELTKTVLESDLVKDAGDQYVLSGPLPSLAIPASLQDSLMARLDRLGAVKEVAQLGATLGRTFNHELLAAVSPLGDEALRDGLSQLMEAELIYRRGLSPDITYEFKHTLVQDAAYQSLLKSTRQQYHQGIAQTLEKQFPQTGKTEPELLAHHYTEAGLAERAIPYWQRAGQRASEHSANVEALAHLTKGLELIKNLPDTPEHAKQELALYITLGPALILIKGYGPQEVEHAFHRARELCQQVGEPAQLFAVTWGLWLLYQFRAQLQTARSFADEVLALAKRQDDPALRLQAHHAAWTTLLCRGEFRSCRDHAERGIALYNRDEHRSHAVIYGGHDPGVCCRYTAAATLWFLGYPDQALRKARDAITLAQELSQTVSLVIAHSFSSWLHQYRREPRLVQEHAEAAIALCTEHGIMPHYLAVGTVLQGWAMAAEGQVAEGVAEIRQGLNAFEATGTKHRKSYYLVLLAQAHGWAGEVEQGLQALAEAFDFAEKTGERTWDAEMHRLKGDLMLARSAKNQSEAATCFNQSIEIARRQSAKSPELCAATSLARLWADQGKRQEACDLLDPIYDWFTQGFDTADLSEAMQLLEKLP
ncbi:MAG: AAA family ATPase [Acidiferrobacterales bacterium]